MKKVLFALILAGGTIFAANAGNVVVNVPGFYLNVGTSCRTPVFTTPSVIVTPNSTIYTTPFYPVRYRPMPPPPPRRHHGPHKRHKRGHRR